MYQNKVEENKKLFSVKNLSAVNRITALWAFSESALGGVLHAFKVPFSGLFICGAAVIFISLIAYFSEKRWTIIKSTLIVVLVKVIISPNTPINAHFAVMVQGFAGQLLFLTKRFPKVSSLFLGIIASMYSAFQKIVVLTLVFGNTLWESIDQFAVFVIKQFYSSVQTDIKFSYWILGIYISIHLLGGIIAGIIAGRLPNWIKHLSEKEDIPSLRFTNNGSFGIMGKSKNKRKRRWWKRPSGIVILIFSFTIALLSYIFPFFGKNKIYDILIMILRSLLIVFVWFTFAAPFLLKLFRKFIAKKKIIYAEEIDEIVGLFPHLKIIINESWKISASSKGLHRIKSFLSYAFVFLILSDFTP
jgi:hypothetical protein